MNLQESTASDLWISCVGVSKVYPVDKSGNWHCGKMVHYLLHQQRQKCSLYFFLFSAMLGPCSTVSQMVNKFDWSVKFINHLPDSRARALGKEAFHLVLIDFMSFVQAIIKSIQKLPSSFTQPTNKFNCSSKNFQLLNTWNVRKLAKNYRLLITYHQSYTLTRKIFCEDK